MGEQTTTVVPFAAGGPSALATSRYLPATARKKNRFSAVPNRSSIKVEKRRARWPVRKNAAEAWPGGSPCASLSSAVSL